MGKFVDITGIKYDNLLVIKPGHRDRKNLLWECLCDCGETCYASSSDLNRGRRNFCITCSNKKSLDTCYNLLYNNYKRNAQVRDKSFNLTIEQFKNIISKKCQYCNLEPKQVFSKQGLKESITYNGIDRRDNSIGYELTNCVPCCKFCNLTKSRFTENEFLEWIKHLKTQ